MDLDPNMVILPILVIIVLVVIIRPGGRGRRRTNYRRINLDP